jgi:hypothetical protein
MSQEASCARRYPAVPGEASVRSWKSPYLSNLSPFSGQSNPDLRLHGDRLADFFGFCRIGWCSDSFAGAQARVMARG